MLSNIGYILKEAFRGLKQAKRMVFLSTTTICLSILIFGLFLVSTLNIRHVVRRLQEKVEIEIYLEDSVSSDQVEHLLNSVRDLKGVMEAAYISKEAALLEAQLDTAFLSAVGRNPLPASIRVRLKEEHRSAEGIDEVINSLQNNPGVEEIASGKQWAHHLDRSILIFSLITTVIGIVFGLASVLIISNTIQLTIFSRREAIGIMQLVGAKNSFISSPFVLEGIFQGLVGGILAVAGLVALHWAAQQKLMRLLPLNHNVLLTFILLGGFLGGLGSGLSVERFLKTQSIP